MNEKLMKQLGSLKELGTTVPLDVAELIASKAAELAPRRTGYLADNIHAEKIEEDSAQVVSGAPYSAHVEFGTVHMEAQPFLRPAIDQYQQELARAAGRAIEEDVHRRLK
jgi:HK97 gp10 family phage protein